MCSTHWLPLTANTISLPATESKITEKCAHEQEVQHSSITPLVYTFCFYSGMVNKARMFYKHLASCLPIKCYQQYCSTLSWLYAPVWHFIFFAQPCSFKAPALTVNASKASLSFWTMCSSWMHIVQTMHIVHMNAHSSMHIECMCALNAHSSDNAHSSHECT